MQRNPPMQVSRFVHPEYVTRRITEMRLFPLLACLLLSCSFSGMTPRAELQTPSSKPETIYLLKPAHVFDGESSRLHDNWLVLVRGNKIEAVEAAKV